MITIDKGLPVPKRYKSGRPYMYPYEQMEIGDSFFVAKNRNGGGALVNHAKKVTGHTFTLRTVTENGVKGVRIWRTA